MSDWSSGYVSDIGYTYGYYSELNPIRISPIFDLLGFHSPNIHSACELGFGQGISINIHAAGSNVLWYGNDFAPSQAGFAQELSDSNLANCVVTDQSFKELKNDQSIQNLDFICLHGIWSWISNENREHIVEFIKNKLNVGGVVYISYNTLPGWSTFAPFRNLLTQHVNRISPAGTNIISRIDNALEFATSLIKTNPAYSKANPQIEKRLETLIDQNRHYLAHEYFNRDWSPMHFDDLRKYLEPTKCDFACSANTLDSLNMINLTAEQSALLDTISDPIFKESVKDFLVNQQFRRDYWVKGLRRLTVGEQRENIQKHFYVLSGDLDKFEYKVKGALGTADLKREIYEPFLDLFADGYYHSIQEVIESIEISWDQINQCLLALVGCGILSPATEPTNEVLVNSTSLNSHIIKKSLFSPDIQYLVSPLTGGGIHVPRFDQIFLHLEELGEGSVSKVIEILNASGQKLIDDGIELSTEAEKYEKISSLYSEFKTRRDKYKSLGF